jgi:hypothetical protein
VAAAVDLPYSVTVASSIDMLVVTAEDNTLFVCMPIARAAVLGPNVGAARQSLLARAARQSLLALRRTAMASDPRRA